MMQQVKPNLRPEVKKSAETITVRLDGDLNERFGKRLDKDFGRKKGKRAKNPTIVGWIKEYADGKRDTPEEDPLEMTQDEVRVFSRLLDLYRRDDTVGELTRKNVEMWILWASRKGPSK